MSNYKKLGFYELIELFSNEVRYGFKWQMTSRELNEKLNKLKEYHFFTKSGSDRYPGYFKTAIIAAIHTTRKIYFNQDLIYCYLIDDQLYTTYNKNRSDNYYFKGITELQNYRVAGKEDRLNNARKNNESITNGFYYPNGKPFFVTTKEG